MELFKDAKPLDIEELRHSRLKSALTMINESIAFRANNGLTDYILRFGGHMKDEEIDNIAKQYEDAGYQVTKHDNYDYDGETFKCYVIDWSAVQ